MNANERKAESLSFDGLVEWYDETRGFDLDCFHSALDFIEERFPPRTFGRLLEPGIGTGRIAIPMAQRGYRVTGVDISEDMLAALRRRLSQFNPPLTISCRKADVTELPFPDGAFDLALVVHLFYFIRDWKKAAREILRVVADRHPIVLMHTGTGDEIPSLNARYKALCEEQGHSIPQIGVMSTAEVVDYFEHLGCRAEWIRDRWKWVARLRLDKALGYLKSRAYSFTAFAPDAIHQKIVEQLQSELQSDHAGLCAEVEVPNQIYLVIIHGK